MAKETQDALVPLVHRVGLRRRYFPALADGTTSQWLAVCGAVGRDTGTGPDPVTDEGLYPCPICFDPWEGTL